MIPAMVLGAVVGIAIWGLLVAILGKDEDEERLVPVAEQAVEDASEHPKPVKAPVRAWQLPIAGRIVPGWLASVRLSGPRSGRGRGGDSLAPVLAGN